MKIVCMLKGTSKAVKKKNASSDPDLTSAGGSIITDSYIANDTRTN